MEFENEKQGKRIVVKMYSIGVRTGLSTEVNDNYIRNPVCLLICVVLQRLVFSWTLSKPIKRFNYIRQGQQAAAIFLIARLMLFVPRPVLYLFLFLIFQSAESGTKRQN